MTYEEFDREWISLGDSLLRVAIGLLGSRQDAEDAVQDLFIKLWRQRESLSVINNPQAYATRVLKNQCIDRIRTSRQTSSLPDEIPGFEAIDSPVENHEDILRTAKAILKLPTNQRKVLEMRLLEGLSYDEISQRTGLTKLSLRVLLSRARMTLKMKI